MHIFVVVFIMMSIMISAPLDDILNEIEMLLVLLGVSVQLGDLLVEWSESEDSYLFFWP